MNKINCKKFLKSFLSLMLISLFCFSLLLVVKIQFAEYKAFAIDPSAFCSSGTVVCSNGLNASCTNSLYRTKCVNGFPDCCISVNNSLSCKPELLICSVTTQSTSSSSSSGLISASCSNGLVICSGGLYPSCTNLSYNPKCVNDFPDCCISVGNSLSCKPEFLVCSTIPQSNVASSSSSSSGAFCLNDQVFCTNGTAICTDSTFALTCVNGFPDCCKKNPRFLDCKPLLLVCSAAASQDQSRSINVDIISNPAFPDIVDLPLVLDEFVGRIGFAFNGSNPSFEIKLPTSIPELEIVSVDVKDSTGVAFHEIPFSVTEIPNSLQELIVSLTLPDEVSSGQLRFLLNLSDGSSLAGLIQVIDFLNVETFQGSKKRINVSNPVISRIFVKKSDDVITLKLRGENFVGRKILYKYGNITKFLETPSDNPNTFVTLFPKNLNLVLQQRSVSSDGKTMIIKFKLTKDLEKRTKAVLVITTPRGAASKSFVIN